jgi:hypothetical protein
MKYMPRKRLRGFLLVDICGSSVDKTSLLTKQTRMLEQATNKRFTIQAECNSLPASHWHAFGNRSSMLFANRLNDIDIRPDHLSAGT